MPDKSKFTESLFRLLADAGLDAAGIFLAGPAGPLVTASTPALARLRSAGSVSAPPLPPPDAAPATIAPEFVGLDCAFAAVVPILQSPGTTAGVLLVASSSSRRLGPKLVRILTDAATIASALVPQPGSGRLPSTAELRHVVRSRNQSQKLVERALRGREDGDLPPTVMILDIDRFRSVNAALGNAAGDAVLTVTGTRLQQVLMPDDLLLRVEGDRFAIVARRAPELLEPLARELLNAVAEPLVLRGRMLSIQARIGMVTGARGFHGAQALLGQAEAAVRRAKSEPHEKWVIHEPTEAALSLDRSRLELDLAHAAQRGELHLVYQPYIDLSTGGVSGAEALMRWRHPIRGELQPLSFIPMAEATGLILPLGRWALRTALTRALDWPTSTMLSVNISPLQFHQSDFLDEIYGALADSRFPANRLELEITETVLMRDNPDTTDRLRALINRGIRIALDDFGTGYSALAYLARLPHHRIKLDKSFVQDLGNPATAELIRAIISLARAQGIAVTAEGVERDEHLSLVRRFGFTHAQGFATGSPSADPVVLRSSARRVSAS